jgi:hypothetical protein
MLDLAGPAEVLSQAARMHTAGHGQADPAALYNVAFHVVSGPGLAQTSAGLAFHPMASEASLLSLEMLDTLVVIGGRVCGSAPATNGCKSRCSISPPGRSALWAFARGPLSPRPPDCSKGGA